MSSDQIWDSGCLDHISRSSIIPFEQHHIRKPKSSRFIFGPWQSEQTPLTAFDIFQLGPKLQTYCFVTARATGFAKNAHYVTTRNHTEKICSAVHISQVFNGKMGLLHPNGTPTSNLVRIQRSSVLSCVAHAGGRMQPSCFSSCVLFFLTPPPLLPCFLHVWDPNCLGTGLGKINLCVYSVITSLRIDYYCSLGGLRSVGGSHWITQLLCVGRPLCLTEFCHVTCLFCSKVTGICVIAPCPPASLTSSLRRAHRCCRPDVNTLMFMLRGSWGHKHPSFASLMVK